MTLTSLEMTQKDMKDEAKEGPNDDKPRYPYGTVLTLDTETLEKLGMKELPPVGTPFVIYAKAEVCSTSQYESQDMDPSQSLGIQITDMSLSETKKSAAEVLYPKKGKA